MTTQVAARGEAVNETCPWSGKPVQADSLTEYRGRTVGFCNTGCRDKFDAAIRHFDDAIARLGTTEDHG